MAPLPGKPALPFTPTADPEGNPTVCRCCGFRSIGIGRNPSQSRKDTDSGFLCKRCILAMEDLTKLDRLDQYELRALEGGVEAAGEWLGERGITDLSLLDELDRLMFCKTIWIGCARQLRKELRGAPF